MGLWLCAGLLALVLSGACHRAGPSLEVSPNPVGAQGTIAGIVRGPEGSAAVAGRTLEIVNAATGERRMLQTGANGGFTAVLPAGSYRIELPLRDGETLLNRPGVVDLASGGRDSHVEIVISAVRVARPRGPAYRIDNGLGAPIV